jgi:hypothetical protein
LNLAISSAGRVSAAAGQNIFLDSPVTVGGAIKVPAGSAILSNVFQSSTTGFIDMVGTLRGHAAAAGGLRVQAHGGQTDPLQVWRSSAAAVLLSVSSDGIPQWNAAGNQQTTVGAAGGASAPPATPTKYFKVKDSAGTTFVVAAYAAA